MSYRSNFIKSELQKIYDKLNICYGNVDFTVLESDTKFIEIIDSLIKIIEESNKLEKIVVRYKFFV